MFSRNPEQSWRPFPPYRSKLEVSEDVSARHSGHPNPFAAHPRANSMSYLPPTCDMFVVFYSIVQYVMLRSQGMQRYQQITTPTDKRKEDDESSHGCRRQNDPSIGQKRRSGLYVARSDSFGKAHAHASHSGRVGSPLHFCPHLASAAHFSCSRQ